MNGLHHVISPRPDPTSRCSSNHGAPASEFPRAGGSLELKNRQMSREMSGGLKAHLGFLGGWTILFCCKCLKMLVGAAGFEPTTCSTQNCRATRLRYTPNVRRAPSIHASQGASKTPRCQQDLQAQQA